jgi:dihydroorotate dehydrogenase electron transfer subunit
MNTPYKKIKIVDKKQETDIVSYFVFDKKINAKPGQFIMLWLAGEDEKPFSVANANPLELAIAAIGPTTNNICKLEKGAELFYRGPYGKAYSLIGKKWLVVGGGYGFAPLRFLIKEGLKKNKNAKIDCVIGAKTKNLLMQEVKHKNIKTYYTTDDGSFGIKGNVLAAVEPLLEKNNYDCIYCCGPEKMMYQIALLGEKKSIPTQISIERYYKCGFGLCGHCSVNGWLSCKDGPVIFGSDALKLKDFGFYYKDKTGAKKQI